MERSTFSRHMPRSGDGYGDGNGNGFNLSQPETHVQEFTFLLDRASSIELLAKHNPQIPHKRRDVVEGEIRPIGVLARPVVEDTDRGQTGLSCGEDVVT